MDELKQQKENIKKWYDETAKDYDARETKEHRSSEYFKPELEGLEKILNVQKGDIALDVATGTGTCLILMAFRGAICYGIDISPKMLEIAKMKTKKLNLKNVAELKLGDADKIPYSDSFFDWITCIGMLEYYPIDHIETILLEFKRALKDNGKLVVDFPDILHKGAHEFKAKSESVKTNVFLYDFRRINALLDDLGFAILKKQTCGFEIQLVMQKKT